MTVLTVTNLPAATHGETVRCLFAIEIEQDELGYRIQTHRCLRRSAAAP